MQTTFSMGTLTAEECDKITDALNNYISVLAEVGDETEIEQYEKLLIEFDLMSELRSSTQAVEQHEGQLLTMPVATSSTDKATSDSATADNVIKVDFKKS